MEPVDKIQLVKSEIEKLPGKKSRGSSYTMICCPFHNDSSPSGRVSHDISNPQFIGFFKCYACGDPMNWNTFAAQKGLEAFSTVESVSVPQTPVDYLDESLLGKDTSRFVQEDLEFYPLDMRGWKKLGLKGPEWRTFKFSFLRSLDAQGCSLEKNYRTNQYVYLPVLIHGKLRGYIKALPEKVEGLPGYFNAPGQWARKYGLWPYDHVQTMMKDKGVKTVVLVEGPRDAMRLVRDGIPALCILGTQSWSNHKILLLEQLGANKIVLCPDSDSAGRAAAQLLYSGYRPSISGKTRVARPLHETFEVEYFSLGDYIEEGDEEIDPCSAPKKAIRDLAVNVT